MRIIFVNRMYENVSGGVERISISIMNDMISRGNDVELISWDRFEAKPFYKLNPNILWHKLNIGHPNLKATLYYRLRRLIKMRKIVLNSKPAVIIAFQQGAFNSIAIACLGLNIQMIAAERAAPQRFDHLSAGKHRWLNFLMFRFANIITVQLNSYILHYPAYLRERIRVIPNPVMQPSNFANPALVDDSIGRWRILCIARLTYQKNIAVLIEAFNLIARQFPQWDLILVGSGEDEYTLKKQVSSARLTNRVFFEGAVSNVEQYYRSSHIFCLPSLWEGFPNSLAEAMSYGLPTIGYSNCAGVNSLIENGKTGLLVEGKDNSELLSQSLSLLMNSKTMRSEMGIAGRQAIMQYSPEKIFRQWSFLFESLIS